MEEKDKEFFLLGKQLKSVFLSFLISNFVFWVEIWLGIEYSKLASSLEEIGYSKNANSLKRAAKLFSIVSVFVFISFGVRVLIFIIDTILPGAPVNPSDPLGSLQSMLPGLALSLIPSIIFGFINSIILLKTWKRFSQVFSRFSPKNKPEAQRSHMRLEKGLKMTIASSFLLIPFVASLIAFALLPLTFILTGIVMVFLFIGLIGVILQLIGAINQGIGIFDISKVMLEEFQTGGQIGRPVEEKQSNGVEGEVMADEEGEFARVIPKRKEFCLECGSKLPDDPDLKYCPSCGSVIN